MSQARRTAEALDTAHEAVKAAASAAVQHSRRGVRSSLPEHINDLYDLATAMETIHFLITQGLAGIVKACADDVRTHYFHGHTPEGEPWPDTTKQAAADADQALSKLRRHLEKTPVQPSRNALAVLHGFLQNLQRAPR